MPDAAQAVNRFLPGLILTFRKPPVSTSPMKRLENGGIVSSRLMGKVRLYTFNPRYPFLRELRQLIESSYKFLPDSEKEKFYRRRTRPRRAGKPQ